MIGKLGLPLLWLVVAVLPVDACGKPRPLPFEDLVAQSDVVAVIDVQRLHSRGKQSRGEAEGRVLELVKGQDLDTLHLQWSGLAITGLGPWLVFVEEKSSGVFVATYGASSFWKRYQAFRHTDRCCENVYVGTADIDLVHPGKKLNYPFKVYFPGVPTEANPIEIEAISETELIHEIRDILNRRSEK